MWIRGRNAVGQFGPWSLVREFEISSRTVPVGSGPAGLTTITTPTFRWKGVAGALHYDLWVNQIGGSTQIIRQQRVQGLSFTPSTGLAPGNYRYWVRAFLSEGVPGPWSAPSNFMVASSSPAILSVTGRSSTSLPTFQWADTGVNGVYDLWVQGTAAQGQVIRQTSLSGTTFVSTQPLPAGSYQAWIRSSAALGSQVRGVPW